MPRFAANLSMMFTEWDFLDRFEAAAGAGFGAVEFLFPYDHPPGAIAERLRRNGLELALFNLPPGNYAAGDRGLAAIPARRAEFEASLRAALPWIEATGLRRTHLMAGLADPADPAAAECYRGAVRLAAETLAPHGVEVLLEPINGRDMPGYFLNDVDRAAALVESLALPNLRLQFDLYHCQILHGDVTARLRRLLPLVGHVQTASVPARHEPERGELNDPFLFAELDRLGYGGFVGCEYRPAAGTLEGLGWFRRATAR